MLAFYPCISLSTQSWLQYPYISYTLPLPFICLLSQCILNLNSIKIPLIPQVLDWLQSMESRVTRLQPVAIDLDALKQQQDELRPLAKEYRDFGITIEKVSEKDRRGRKLGWHKALFKGEGSSDTIGGGPDMGWVV